MTEESWNEYTILMRDEVLFYEAYISRKKSIQSKENQLVCSNELDFSRLSISFPRQSETHCAMLSKKNQIQPTNQLNQSTKQYTES